MLHNMNNTDLDSYYTPSQGLIERVAQCTQILDEVALSSNLTAGFTQKTPGRLNGIFANTIEGDVFNALGKFFYAKSYAGNGSVNISIQDYYDWERAGDSPGGVLVDILVTAQEIKVVTPFYTKIDITVPGVAPLSWEYYNNGVKIIGVDKNISHLEIPTSFFDLRVKEESLPSVNVISIGNSAFENCTKLNNIVLPNTITEIGNNAFKNCSIIQSINIPNKVNYIGVNVFDGCELLNEIFVDISKICDYVNNQNLMPYIDLLKTYGTIAEYDFNCRTVKIDENKELTNDEKFLYKLNIDCQIQYEIEAESNKKIIINIYKSDYTLLEKGTTIELSSGKYLSYICPLLERGEYYIEICYSSMEDSGTINYLINPHTSTDDYISTDDEVDVLTHLHENKNEFIISPSKSGLFLLELFAKVDGEYINPNGEFIIKNSSGEIVQKMNLSEYNHPAESVVNANNIMFYANQWGGYTVYLEVSDLQYDELTLKVNEVEDFTIYDMDEDDKYISNSNIQIGDFAYIYNLERIGTYNITFEYQGTQSDEMLFVLFETNEQGEYVYKDSYEINNFNSSIELVEVLTDSKNLLLCVFDSEGLGNLNIEISKELNNEFTIYGASDPSASLIYLTKGSQEICYLGADAPNPTSRYTYYNWYSTNESVINVSAYGTVTAVGVGEAKVQCVYKYDTSVVATLDFVVISDPLDNGDNANDIYLNYGFDVRTGGTISGTEVTSGKGAAISVSYNPYVSIHVTYTRLICLGSDSPNSSVQSFNWRAYREEDDTGMVNVSQFGTITGVTSGWVTVEGTYKYNSRYKIKIRIYVESNI